MNLVNSSAMSGSEISIIPVFLIAQQPDLGTALLVAIAGFSVIFIAGNIPMESEILPLIIISKLEQFDIQGASAVALFMLMISFVILLSINIVQWKLSRRVGAR